MSNSEEWYSTKVRLVCLVDPVGGRSFMDCVHIFRAEDWDDALQRAIVLGREHEKEYRNAEGHAVRWRLMEVVSLDLIRSETLDGAEVHSTLTDIPSTDAVAFDATFNPEESRPVQTF